MSCAEPRGKRSMFGGLIKRDCLVKVPSCLYGVSSAGQENTHDPMRL